MLLLKKNMPNYAGFYLGLIIVMNYITLAFT